MTEDNNIKKAIRREIAERPPMPADLNARLMQRVEKEVNLKPQTKHRRIIWPWVAAACVAGVLVMFLTPPKSSELPEEKQMVASAKHEITTALSPQEKTKKEVAATETKPSIKAKTKVLTVTEETDEKLVAQVEEPIEQPETTVSAPQSGEENVSRMLTERDIPITRPENYRHTREEIALMRKQADEAYLKWAELELKIANYNMETAQQ